MINSKKLQKLKSNIFLRGAVERERENALEIGLFNGIHISFEAILISLKGGTKMYYVGMQQLHSYFLSDPF